LLNEFALYVKLCQSSELYGLGYGKRYFSTVQGAKQDQWKGKRYLVYLYMDENKPFGSFE
jgi:hypothetical protein